MALDGVVLDEKVADIWGFNGTAPGKLSRWKVLWASEALSKMIPN